MMCVTCGCGSTGESSAGDRGGIVFPHDHGDEGSLHGADSHGTGPHSHGLKETFLSKTGVHGESRRISVEEEILGKNNRLAKENRVIFDNHGIFVVNLLSSPGSGKTTLLERTIARLSGAFPLAVIEGDQETSRDADRIRMLGVPAVQINTGAGCHLDAHQVAHACMELELVPGMVLIIENIGNLVCPALFDLGESKRVVLFSVTEGEDKPIKYPRMFRGADMVLLTKSDLLPVLEFDRSLAEQYTKSINPHGEILSLSARTGEGMDPWISWIVERRAQAFQNA